MSFLGLSKKKSAVPTSNTSPTSSLRSSFSGSSAGSNTGCNHKNTFVKFDEKKDYVRRCHMKKKFSSSGDKNPAPISFCLGKKYWEGFICPIPAQTGIWCCNMVVGIKRKLIYLVIYRITLVNREIIMYYILRIRLESLSRLSKYMSCIIQDDMFQEWTVLFLDYL